MSWFSRTPFGPGEDPVQRMLDLVAIEAASAGSPISGVDRRLLTAEFSNEEAVPADLRDKAKAAVERLLDTESPDEFEREPKSFSNCVQWAGDRGHSNIVALTEGVMRERSERDYPQLSGWKKVTDRTMLVVCGVLVVLLLFGVGAGIDALFSGR